MNCITAKDIFEILSDPLEYQYATIRIQGIPYVPESKIVITPDYKIKIDNRGFIYIEREYVSYKIHERFIRGIEFK